MILWATLLIVAMPGAALVNPSRTEKAAIRDHITSATDAERELVKKRRELKAAADPKQKKDVESEIERLSNARADSYNEAIYLALAAYGIIPPGDLPHGTSVFRGPNRGKTVTWLPMFEDNYPHEVINEIGKVQQGLYKDPDALAITSADGVSRIFPETLSSPDQLALILVHEKVHFDQVVTPGRADTLTLSEREVEAYSAEKEIIDKNVLNMPDWALDFQRDRIETRLAQYEAKAKDDRAAVTRAKGLPLPEFDIKSHTKDELDSIRKGAAELRAKVETERHKTAPPMAAKLPGDGPKAATPPGEGPKAAEISDDGVPSDTSDLANRLCGGAPVSQQDLDQLLLRLASYIRRKPMASALDTNCEGALYDAMCSAALTGQALDIRTLRAKAQDFRDRNKTVAPPPSGSGSSSAVPFDAGRDRGRERTERSRGHDIPERHWNPHF